MYLFLNFSTNGKSKIVNFVDGFMYGCRSLLIFTVISGVSEYMVLGTQRGRKTIFVGIFVLLCLCISIFVTYRRWRNVND